MKQEMTDVGWESSAAWERRACRWIAFWMIVAALALLVFTGCSRAETKAEGLRLNAEWNEHQTFLAISNRIEDLLQAVDEANERTLEMSTNAFSAGVLLEWKINEFYPEIFNCGGDAANYAQFVYRNVERPVSVERFENFILNNPPGSHWKTNAEGNVFVILPPEAMRELIRSRAMLEAMATVTNQ